MNNDFIQELKEKRERYGVSQSRLAVACGISREYSQGWRLPAVSAENTITALKTAGHSSQKP